MILRLSLYGRTLAGLGVREAFCEEFGVADALELDGPCIESLFCRLGGRPTSEDEEAMAWPPRGREDEETSVSHETRVLTSLPVISTIWSLAVALARAGVKRANHIIRSDLLAPLRVNSHCLWPHPRSLCVYLQMLERRSAVCSSTS